MGYAVGGMLIQPLTVGMISLNDEEFVDQPWGKPVPSRLR